MKIIIWILCIIYCLSPIDLAPGPLDDAIAAVAVFGLTSLSGMGGNNRIEKK